MEVEVTDDASHVLHDAAEFLCSKPAEHNLLFTLLNERASHPEPGRFWSVRRGGDVAAVMFQSPLTFHAAITPAAPDAVIALTESATEVAADLPGVSGEAATAALFAGCWAERRKTPAVPVEGQRLYELRKLRHPKGVPGRLRRAGDDDAERLIGWMRGFEADTGGAAATPETLCRRMGAGLVWVWQRDDHEAVAMAALTTPLAGVTRVGLVYTPPQHRRHGYAAACTAAISQVGLEDMGAERCILYTQLSNPQSNAIYRSLGFEPIQETVHYRFG
jgi:predicted GNAT family acetyltransferase